MAVILHILPRRAWEIAQMQGTYRGDTLEAEGFIHFSTPAQAVKVANARFKGHPGLMLLIVDEDKLHAPLRYEAPYEASGFVDSAEQFPHLYGELNLDAVINALPFEPEADGEFILPSEIDR